MRFRQAKRPVLPLGFQNKGEQQAPELGGRVGGFNLDGIRQLNSHLAVFIKRGRIASPVVKLRRAGVGVVRHFPSFGQRTVALQVISNARGAHGVIADAGFDARPLRMALYQPVCILLRQPVRCAGRTPRGAKQRPIFIVPDAGRRNILIEVRFQLWNAWRFVFLAALLMQAHPPAPPLAEVITHGHLQNGGDTANV